MATTKAMLIERVQKKLEGGTTTTRSRASYDEIAHELNAFLSAALKLQMFHGFDEGDSVPDGSMIATYENIPIDRRDNGKSSAKLPATPMIIPGGIGIFSVYPSGYPEKEYIPVQKGLLYTVTGNKLLNPLGRKFYTYGSGRVTINDDAIGAGVTHLDIQMCITDIVSMDNDDVLPIPADVEAAAIIAVLQLFGVETPVERADNKAASPTKLDAK